MQSMRIAFNTRILSNPVLRGWNRYALNLVSELANLGAKVFLYTDRTPDSSQLSQLPLDSLTLRQAPAMSYLRWEQYWLPQQCRRDGIDVFHSPTHFGLPQMTRSKCVLTLHDAIDEVYYAPTSRNRSRAQRVTTLLGRMARLRADHIVTVSEHSRRDLMEHFKIPDHRISVIYEAADQRFRVGIPAEERERVREKFHLPSRFLLYVGSLEPRKNIPFLMRALAEAAIPDLGLVLGGGSTSEQQDLRKLAAELSIDQKVLVAGRIDDRDLAAFYAEAYLFVYPSEYEGFGLQVCEAMASGCPVLAARASCLPEILGNGGDTFSLSDPGELIRSLRGISRNGIYREELRQRALLRSRSFSWTKTAQQTQELYHRICGYPAPATQHPDPLSVLALK